jgi:hypothetical protein
MKYTQMRHPVTLRLLCEQYASSYSSFVSPRRGGVRCGGSAGSIMRWWGGGASRLRVRRWFVRSTHMTCATGEGETLDIIQEKTGLTCFKFQMNLRSSDVSSQSTYPLHVDSFERFFVNRIDDSFSTYGVNLPFQVIECSLLH